CSLIASDKSVFNTPTQYLTRSLAACSTFFTICRRSASGRADQPVHAPVSWTGLSKLWSQPRQYLLQLLPQRPRRVDQHQSRAVEPQTGIRRSHVELNAQHLGQLRLTDLSIEIPQQAMILDRIP